MPIEDFEEETQELNQYEKDVLVPDLIKGFRKHVGKENVISSTKIVAAINLNPKYTQKINDTDVRRLVHHIRVRRLLHGLASTNKGYFVISNKEELRIYINSLSARINSQTSIKEAMLEYEKSLS